MTGGPIDLGLVHRLMADLKMHGVDQASHRTAWDGPGMHNFIVLKSRGTKADAMIAMQIVEAVFPGSLITKGGCYEQAGEPVFEVALCIDPTREMLDRAARASDGALGRS